MTAAVLALVEQEVKDVGSFSSLSLALLVLFTNRRAESLEGWQEGTKRTEKGRARWDVYFDCVLLAATVLLLLALFPLLYDVLDELSLGQTRASMRSLFVLVWFGFVALFAFQVWIFVDRLRRFRRLHP